MKSYKYLNWKGKIITKIFNKTKHSKIVFCFTYNNNKERRLVPCSCQTSNIFCFCSWIPPKEIIMKYKSWFTLYLLRKKSWGCWNFLRITSGNLSSESHMNAFLLFEIFLTVMWFHIVRTYLWRRSVFLIAFYIFISLRM